MKKNDEVYVYYWFGNILVTPVNASMTRWKLMRDFPMHIRISGKIESMVVPKGFVTDFASVPWIFRLVFPQMGKYGAAAVVHDYMTMTRETPFTRKEADRIFYSIMERHGVKSWKAKLMYGAVRLHAVFTGVDGSERVTATKRISSGR